MVLYSFKNYFKGDYIMLRFAGTWIGPGSENIPKWYKYYSYGAHLSVTLIFMLSLAINWILSSTTLYGLASLGYVVLTLVMGQLKTAFLLHNKDLIGILYDKCDTHHFQIKDQEELVHVKQKLKQFTVLKTALQIMVWSSPLLKFTAPIMSGNMEELLFPAWWPFNITVSPRYQFIYAHQTLGLWFIVIGNVYGDILMAGYCTLIGLQCDLLCMRLREVWANGENDRQSLINCFLHYNEILRYLKGVEKVFGIIYFWQMIASTTSLCMALFLLSLIQSGTFESVFLIAYLFGVAYILFIPCWFATEMTTKSENISIAAYSCNWIEVKESFKKDLLLFICRSQKPLKLSGANFFEISVVTFLTVVRASFSYYAVMGNLNEAEQNNG